MARYMGGPRGSRPRPDHGKLVVSPTPNDYEADDSAEDLDNMQSDQTKDEIPDTDDIASSCQDDQGGLLQNGHQLESDSEIGEKGQMVDDEDENGIAYPSEYDSESIASAVSLAPVYAVRENNAATSNGVGNTGPPLKRQRSLSIPIHYKSRFITGQPIFEPQPLSIAYGWMAKGTAEHIEDLHLSGIPFCNREVHSKTKIEVLGEYTWIEVTPSQEESYERFPAIYVPGNTRTWRGLTIDTSLEQDDIRLKTSQRMRDDHLHRQPRYPYEPTFRALESSPQATSFKEIDIVTDDETLTQLLSFIMGASPARRASEPFRLELASVRNTLFITPSRKPGSSQAGPPPKKVRQDPHFSVPDWADGVLGEIGTRDARLPYSGAHYRLVRYRFGSVVLAVRVKVDFAYEHRRDTKRAAAATDDPLHDVQPAFMPRQGGDVAQVWRTTVKKQGPGTRPAAAGVASARYAWQDQKERMRALLPRLWFSRTPFVVDCQVGHPGLEVREAALVNSRRWYPSYERGYQGSLRRLAGLLRHLQERTREMGGGVVLIADPVQICFVLLKPVIERRALPAELVLKFWGPDEDEEERERRAEMDRESTPEQEQSDLTDLSDTPSLPSGSEIANVESSQPEHAQAGANGTSSPMAGGSPTRAERQLAQGIDPVKMVKDWKKTVRSPLDNPVGGDGTAYEPDHHEYEDPYDADASHAGYPSSSQGSVMVGESAYEPSQDGADTVLNNLALQMNHPGMMQETDHRIAAVDRDSDTEVLRGQHSLLLADRHLTAGMHTSDDEDDGEWPTGPRPALHGRITNDVPLLPDPDSPSRGSSVPSSPVVLSAPTPLGPSDFDEEGNFIDRNTQNKRLVEEDSDESEENLAPRTSRAVGRTRWESEAARRRRLDLTASGRARMGHPTDSWRCPLPPYPDSDETPDATSSQSEDDSEEPTSSPIAGQQENNQASSSGGVGDGEGAADDDMSSGRQSGSSEHGEAGEYDPAHEF